MDLILASIFCAIIALISRKTGFTPIPLYLIIGFILGYYGIIKGGESLKVVSHLGIIFLLFYIGMKITPSGLKKNFNKILLAGIFDFLTNLIPVFLILKFLGLGLLDIIVISMAVYISSSAINLQLLVERKKLIFSFAETVVWLMIFEDIVLVIFIAFLSAVNIFEFSRFFLLLIPTYLLYRYHRPISNIFRRDDEIPYLATFFLPTFILYLVEKLRISEVLTAILFGMSMAKYEIEKFIYPFKEVFMALFFIYSGSMIRIENINFLYTLVLLIFALIGKFIGSYLIAITTHKSLSDTIEIFKYTVARGELSVIVISLYAPGYSGIIAIIILITSILSTILTRIEPRS